MSPDSLDALGRHLFGDRYVTSLAEALGRHTKNSVAPSHVTMWAKGRRSIPRWVDGAALKVAEEGLLDLEARRKAVEAILATPWDYGIQPGLPDD